MKRKGQEKSFILSAILFVIILAIVILILFKYWPIAMNKVKDLGLF